MQFSKWVTMGFGAVCLVATAINVGMPHLYYMAAFLLTLPCVSVLLGWRSLQGLEFAHEMPNLAWEGEEGVFRFVTKNPTRIARFFLAVHEPLPAWIEAVDEETALFNVAALDTSRIEHKVRFRRRGVYATTGFNVTAMDPLGVFAFTRHVAAEGELVVYPLPQSLRETALSGTERYGWQEFSSRLLRGSSVDPDGVRPYVPGDSMRRIHWRQTARTGKLSIIEFEEAHATNLVIALDLEQGTEIGQGEDTTLEYAVRLAASLTQEAIGQGAGVRLLLPPAEHAADKTIDKIIDKTRLSATTLEGRGQSHLYLILDALARVQADANISLKKVIADNALTVQPGTTLLVITSKPDPTLSEAFSPYLAVGVKVGVAFVDPDSFLTPQPDRRSEANESFLASLSSLRCPTYLVRRQDNGLLDPEEYSYVPALEPLNA